jgi:hypothetical protein
MKQKSYFVRGLLALPVMAVLLNTPALMAQNQSVVSASSAVTTQVIIAPEKVFDAVADQALVAMKARAEELKIKGAAVLAYFEGDTIKSWTSKMVIVGSVKNAPSQNDKGANLLGIAYAKAAEMADTHQNSGSGSRPPMTGEFGWKGGLIKKCKTGYLIAAFSGGPDVDDLKVAQVGLDILAAKL